MNEPARVAVRDRVVLDSESQHVRQIGRSALLGASGVSVLLVARYHYASGLTTVGGLTWSLSLSLAVILAARGILLGRSITVSHGTASVLVAATGLVMHVTSFQLLSDGLVAGAGLVLTWPVSSRRDPGSLPRVWTLVEATHGDPLAPFAMQAMKSYYFNADETAAIAYAVRLGLAVVSGDPIGQAAQFPQLAGDFAAMCRRHGWRVVVLGCGEQWVALWRDRAVVGRPLRAIPIGRDVVVDVRSFDMTGRKYRNLRQAVQRTHNAGIATEVVDEQHLDDALADELAEVLYASHRGALVQRGFSMILDSALEGRYPGVQLIVARDRSGRVQGFQRYATAGGGTDVTLDVAWRRPGAPNGIDERMSVDMIGHCKSSDGERLSLAFGAFPEIFDSKNRSFIDGVYYALIHLGHSLIKLEPLYRYLRKFNAFDQRRYVLLSRRQIPVALVVLLSLEFLPRPRRYPGRQRCQRHRDPLTDAHE